MSILLTSNGWEDNEKIKEEFLNLLSEKKLSKIKVLLINTATEQSTEWKYVQEHIEKLKKVGVDKENIIVPNLTDEKVETPFKVDVIYMCGGNTYEYLHKIRKTGLDKIIKSLVEEGVHYFGISAGSILAGPNIAIASVGLEDSGDKNEFNLKDLTALDLVEIIVHPHYQSEDEKLVSNFEKENNVKAFRLKDGEALLIENSKRKIIE